MSASFTKVLTLSLLVPVVAFAVQPANEPKELPAAVALIEDDTDVFMKQLHNDGGLDATQIRQEFRDVFSGVSSLRVTPFQRFSARIPNWNYPVVENPQAGQYRFIRFAWKRVEGAGIMVQLHSNGSWNQRYYAGARSDQTASWGAMIQVDPKMPTEWTVVTRDLFKDFGALTLQGFALTPMEGGVAGFFDHVYLGRSIEDLDRATASAFGKTPLKEPLTPIQLGKLWDELARSDQKAAGSAMRTLAAGRKESVPYLQQVLKQKPLGGDAKQIARWIQDLDSESFILRETAHRSLDQLGDAAIRHLQNARTHPTSPEQRCRIEALLKNRGVTEGELTNEQIRVIRVARVLEWSGTPEALAALDALATEPPDASVTADFNQARERLRKQLKR